MAGITIIKPTNTFKFVRANNDFPAKKKPKKIDQKTRKKQEEQEKQMNTKKNQGQDTIPTTNPIKTMQTYPTLICLNHRLPTRHSRKCPLIQWM